MSDDTQPRTWSIEETLAILLAPGQVAELRALAAGRYRSTVSGYFDDWGKMSQAAAAWDGKAEGIYWMLNPCVPALLARAANRARELGRDPVATKDGEILARRWLLVDCDFDRPKGISSTQEEWTAAHRLARRLRKALMAAGWPAPVLADSGNGAHLLWRIELPNDAAATALVERVLQALALLWDDAVPGVKVDTSNGNASRICKLYGTHACKGDSTPDRPHRLARLLAVPEPLEIVSRDQLEALAAQLPRDPAPDRPAWRGGAGAPLDLPAWLREHGLTVRKERSVGDGTLYLLEACPWDGSHTDKSAYVIQFRSGALAAGCHHDSCQGKGWAELRALYEPARNTQHATRNTPSDPPDEWDAPAATPTPDTLQPESEPNPQSAIRNPQLRIDPAAQPPFDRWEALRAKHPKAALTWARQRRDLRSQAPAVYSLALARMAAEAGWSDQEIADLLLAAARFHRDPEPRSGWGADITRTLAKARQALPGAEEDAALPAEADRPARLAMLSARLGVEIRRVVKYEADRPLWYLDTAKGRTKPDTVECLLDNRTFRLRLAEATGHLCPLLKAGAWDSLAQLLLDVAEAEDIGAEATPLGAIRAWVDAYLEENPPATEKIELSIGHYSPFVRDGVLYLFGSSLGEWIWTKRREQLGRKDLGQMLRLLGATPETIHITQDGQRGSRQVWRLPAGSGPQPVPAESGEGPQEEAPPVPP